LLKIKKNCLSFINTNILIKKMKKILITGADGFIGSHLTESLLKKGHKVVAIAHYNSFNFHG